MGTELYQVLERAGQPGGAALRSMGSLWTFTDPERYARSCPGADPEVAGILQRGFHEAVAWLRQLGVPPTANPSSMFGSTNAFQLDVPRLMGRWAEVVARHGGTTTSTTRRCSASLILCGFLSESGDPGRAWPQAVEALPVPGQSHRPGGQTIARRA